MFQTSKYTISQSRAALMSGLLFCGLALVSTSAPGQQPPMPQDSGNQAQAAAQDHTGGHGQGGGRGNERGGMQAGNDQGEGRGMGQGRGERMEGGMGDGMGGGMMMQRMHSGLHSGQSAFDVIATVIDQLESNPDTDWSRVNIDALREHLIDMNQLTLYAEVETSTVDGGVRYRVSGSGRTREAIKRMVPAHANQLRSELDWNMETELSRSGVILTVTSDDPAQVARIRALGFMGFMVQGNHHAAHHLMIAGGQPAGGMDHGGMGRGGDGSMGSGGGGHGG